MKMYFLFFLESETKIKHEIIFVNFVHCLSLMKIQMQIVLYELLHRRGCFKAFGQRIFIILTNSVQDT